eukprot:m.117904 g.117904  ORF g.117904 m.117904 type:complete len:228 (-) comp28615_c1_seq3:116-799(-)
MLCCGGSKKPPTPTAKVFGAVIEQMQANELDGNIPRVLKESATFLRSSGLATQGLFRRAAHAQKMKTVKEKYNQGENVNFEEFGGVHMAANVMKSFLRDLQEPLMTTQFYPILLKFVTTDDVGQASQKCRQHLTSLLPGRNLTVLRALMLFLMEVVAEEENNGMNCSNVAIVFGPNLFWGKGAGPSSTKVPSVDEMSKISTFTQFMLENSQQIFASLEAPGYDEALL